MKITRKQLKQIIAESIEAQGKAGSSLPWVFGPDGYSRRPALDFQSRNKDDIGAESPPEVMIARALAYRASEITNYKKEFDDSIFSSYAMNIVSSAIPQYIADMIEDEKDQEEKEWSDLSEHEQWFKAMDQFLNRIDDGGWDDDEIMEIAMDGEYDSVDFEDRPEHPDDDAMRADHQSRQIAGDIPEDEEYIPYYERSWIDHEDNDIVSESQESAAPSPPSEDELIVIFDELKVPVQEQSQKIKELLRKFTEDSAAAADELKKMFDDAAEKVDVVGKDVLDAAGRKIWDSLDDSSRDWILHNFFGGMGASQAPSASPKSTNEVSKNASLDDVKQLIREILENNAAEELGEATRSKPWAWQLPGSSVPGRRPAYGEGNLTISDVQELFPSLSPGEQDDIWEKYKHLNNAGELKAAILGL